MDLQQQQQMLLALLRPQLAPNLAPLNLAQQSSTPSIDTTTTAVLSAANGIPPSLAALRQMMPPTAQPQPQIIRRISAESPLGVFDPAQLASPALPVDGLFPPRQDGLSQNQLEHLMALANLQHVIERIRAAEAAQKCMVGGQQQFGTTVHGGQQQIGPQNHSLLPSTPQFIPPAPPPTMLPSAFSSPAQRQPPVPTPEPPPKQQQQTEENGHVQQQYFVPTPSTSADQLLTEALVRLVHQTDNELLMGSVGSECSSNGVQQTSEGSSNGGDGPANCGTLPPPAVGEEVLLCKVCSDRASGFHYGIFSCEGCKGFFRRSLQNKIDYRPCTQSQKCQIIRANRNRCQECRWRKCIEAGMSKDGVRYGRVPKREKEKLREEMRRDSVRSILEQLALDLADENRLQERLQRAWTELGRQLAETMFAQEKTDAPGTDDLVDANRLCAFARAFVRFAAIGVAGFRLLRKQERVQLIKDAFFPVLLLRLCTPLRSETPLDLTAIPGALLLPRMALQNMPMLGDCSMEFVHRMREAQPPVELALSDSQLAICAAICLCRLDGAGDSASGAATTQSGAWEEQNAQLGQAVCRRIRDRLLQLLNCSLGIFAAGGDRPSPMVCQFGSALLRTDLLVRQNLASMFERLKQCRDLHRQLMTTTTCWNVPQELFAPPQPQVETTPAGTNNADSSRKRKAGQQGEEVGAGVAASQQQQQTTLKQEKDIKPSIKQESLPTLRRVLEQPPVVPPLIPSHQTPASLPMQTAPSTTGNPNPQPSLTESHREVAQLLAQPSLLSTNLTTTAVATQTLTTWPNEEEQPLNLCLRDAAEKN